MNRLRVHFSVIILLLCVGCLTSCDEGATVDVAGPDICFEFTCLDSIQTTNIRNSDHFVLVAQSDTILGKDIESFLSESGQDYESVVETATINNAFLTLSGSNNFAGVDSVQIRYQIIGTDDEIVLAQGGINGENDQSIGFDDLKIGKDQAFQWLKNNTIARLYAIYHPETANCFNPGVVFQFTAKTTLNVKLSAITDGFLGSK